MRRRGRQKINSAIFPGIQGGPLMHVIAAKAVAFKGSAVARVQGLPAAGGEERRGDGETLIARGLRIVRAAPRAM